MAALVGTLGGLPQRRLVVAEIARRRQAIRVGRRRSANPTDDPTMAFVRHPVRVGAAHFPFPLERPRLEFPQHETHVFLSVERYRLKYRTEALRLLAQATSAIAHCWDAEAVWWSVGDRVLTPAVFTASVRREAGGSDRPRC